jgi:SAM-dependent methyltransferase
MSAIESLDRARAERFAQQMVEVFNHGALTLMCSIGYRTGLFDVMATLPPSTTSEIADAADLHERYVREWLGAMTTSRVVEYDPAASTFELPAEHAACLTRTAGPENIGIQMQFIGMLAEVESKIVEAFRNGGGVGYEHFHAFHRVMADESASVHDTALIDAILPLVPDLPDGLAQGIDVADIGCGSGHAVNLMARAFPASRFTGFDISEEGLTAARAEAGELGLANARFELADAATLDVSDAFDLVTAFDAIHDQAHPTRVLANIHRALRPGGVFLMVDIKGSSNLEDNLDHPLATFLYTASTMHCMTVSLALDGEGLGTMWGEQLACRLLSEAGFDEVQIAAIDGDLFNSYYIART